MEKKNSLQPSTRTAGSEGFIFMPRLTSGSQPLLATGAGSAQPRCPPGTSEPEQEAQV